jgi:hypothetical protein
VIECWWNGLDAKLWPEIPMLTGTVHGFFIPSYELLGEHPLLAVYFLTCLSLKTVWRCFRRLLSKNISLISVYNTCVSVDVPQNIKLVPCSACLPTINSLVMTLCYVKLHFPIGQYSFSVFHIHYICCILYIFARSL